MTSFNLSLKEDEILIYIDKDDIQLSVPFAHGFLFLCGTDELLFNLIQGKHGVILCGLKLASENPLASGNEADNFEGMQFRSLFLKKEGISFSMIEAFFLQDFRIVVTYAIVCAVFASCYSFECSCPSATWLFMDRSMEFLLISQVFKNNELNITTLKKGIR